MKKVKTGDIVSPMELPEGWLGVMRTGDECEGLLCLYIHFKDCLYAFDGSTWTNLSRETEIRVEALFEIPKTIYEITDKL